MLLLKIALVFVCNVVLNNLNNLNALHFSEVQSFTFSHFIGKTFRTNILLWPFHKLITSWVNLINWPQYLTLVSEQKLSYYFIDITFNDHITIFNDQSIAFHLIINLFLKDRVDFRTLLFLYGPNLIEVITFYCQRNIFS